MVLDHNEQIDQNAITICTSLRLLVSLSDDTRPLPQTKKEKPEQHHHLVTMTDVFITLCTSFKNQIGLPAEINKQIPTYFKTYAITDL